MNSCIINVSNNNDCTHSVLATTLWGPWDLEYFNMHDKVLIIQMHINLRSKLNTLNNKYKEKSTFNFVHVFHSPSFEGIHWYLSDLFYTVHVLGVLCSFPLAPNPLVFFNVSVPLNINSRTSMICFLVEHRWRRPSEKSRQWNYSWFGVVPKQKLWWHMFTDSVVVVMPMHYFLQASIWILVSIEYIWIAHTSLCYFRLCVKNMLSVSASLMIINT